MKMIFGLSLLFTFLNTGFSKEVTEWNCTFSIGRKVEKFDISAIRTGKPIEGTRYKIESPSGKLPLIELYYEGITYGMGEYHFHIQPYIYFHDTNDCVVSPNICDERRSKYSYHGFDQKLVIGHIQYPKNSLGSSNPMFDVKVKDRFRPKRRLVKKVFPSSYLHTKKDIHYFHESVAGDIDFSCKKK